MVTRHGKHLTARLEHTNMISSVQKIETKRRFLFNFCEPSLLLGWLSSFGNSRFFFFNFSYEWNKYLVWLDLREIRSSKHVTILTECWKQRKFHVQATRVGDCSMCTKHLQFRGRGNGSVHASHPAGPGLVPTIPKYFQKEIWCCWDFMPSSALLRQ